MGHPGFYIRACFMRKELVLYSPAPSACEEGLSINEKAETGRLRRPVSAFFIYLNLEY
jgi:hypothetical protein